MLNIFKLKNNLLTCVDWGEPLALREAIWVDLIEPSTDECEFIEKELGANPIDYFNLKTVNRNNRFGNSIFCIRSLFFYNEIDYVIDSINVVFVVYNGRLYTLRKREIPVFLSYKMYINDNKVILNDNIYTILLDLFGVKLDYLSDKVESIYSDLEVLSVLIMNGQQIEEYNSIFSTLANLEEFVWKIHWSLLDTQRAISSVINNTEISDVQVRYAKDILNNIDCLLPYNEVLLQKVNFLIQSTMGFINIEQNRIIRIFSIVFLPPTLVASSYGMNFEFMPELKWVFGYPGAIILMILTGLLPYLYFKHKNWL